MASPICSSYGSPWLKILSPAKQSANVVRIFFALLLLTLFSPSASAQSTLSPTKLSFGNQPMGVASSAQTATFKNTQRTALTIGSIAISGTNASDFSWTGNCPLSPSRLAGSASCAIQVTFTPAAQGSRTAKLTVTSNSFLSPQSVSLSGTGTAPVTLSSSSLAFGSVVVGNTSSARSVTLTNLSGSTLNFSSIAASGSFAIASNTCGAGIATGANCSVGVTYAPNTTGTSSGILTFTDNATNSPQNVSLSGSGTAAVTVSPTSLSFSSQALDTISTAKTITLTNHLSTSLTVSSPTATGDFLVSSNSCTTVNAGLTCTVGIQFKPTAQGTRTGTLSISFSAFGSPISVGLTGTGSGPTLTSIAVTPATPSIPLGQTQQFAATGTYSDGSQQNLTTTATWSSSSTSIATIGSRSGLASSVAAGAATIKAVSGSISGTAVLTVAPPTLVSISVTPASPSLQLGKTQQFTATGTYTNNSTQNLTASVTWSSSLTAVAAISAAGLATPASIGVTTIQATSGSISGGTTLSVTAAGLVSMSVAPTGASVPLGTPEQFTATGNYTDGTQQNLTSSVTWTSSAATVATINAAGLATPVGAGSTTIKAVSGSLSSSTTLTVTPAALVSINVTPANPSVTQGATQQFTATGTYTNNSTQNITATVTWASSATTVAAINGAGLASTPGAGSALITATSGSISGSSAITVNPPQLLSIAVTPAAPSIALGINQQFTAMGTYNNGTQQNLTASATWGSSVTTVTTVSAAGMATSLSAGSSVISATSGSISGTAALTVTPPQLLSITLSPITASIVDGNAQQFTATGNYTDGSTQNLTASATWTSSAGAIATINAGLAASTGIGSTVIKVTSGTISASTTLTVTAAPLVSIAVTPGTPSVPLGYTQQLTATGTDAAGNTQDLTSSVTWTSATTTAATVTAAGLADGVGQGTSVITATSGSISGSITLTVTPAQLLSIAVTPANSSLLLGNTQQFTAMGSYTDGTMQDLTSTVTWTSSTATIAAINPTGLATSAGAGIASISAASGTVSGATNLTVLLSETPTLVEHVSIAGSGNLGQPFISFAMDPCLAGNLIVVPFTFASGSGVKSAVVTDDKGDVFSYALAQPGKSDSNQVTNIAYASNCTPGASTITIAFTGGAPPYVEAQASTFYNVATSSPLDGVSSSTGTGTASASGSLTTTANGDLIYNYVVQDTQTLSSFKAGSAFSFLGVDLLSLAQQAAQYQVQGSAAAVNPSMTLSTSAGWNSVSAAFKAAPAGTAPTGIHIVHMLQAPLAQSPLAQTIQFPATGNLLAMSDNNGVGDTITSMTDSLGNSWGTCGGTGNGAIDYEGGGITQIWYAGNTNTGTNMTVTTNRASDANSDVIFLYDIAGAAAAPCDTRNGIYGYSQNPGPVTSASVTPDTPNGLILWTLGVDTNSVPSVTAPAGAVFDSVVQATFEQDDPPNQNNGWGHYYNATTAPVTFVVPGGVGNTEPGIYGAWVSDAAAFEAFTGTNAPAITSLSANSGATGTSIIIAGTNLGSVQGTSTLTFNGAPATVISWASNQIVVTVPTAATTGYVVVTTPGGVSNGTTFTVTTGGN